MLSPEDKATILSDFPNVKLSYETIIHKKVYNTSDLIIAIPKGKKCFAWYTTFKEKPTCFLMELDRTSNNKFANIKIINTCCSNQLCYGTIIYGTYFFREKHPFFAAEDVFQYRGNNISNYNFKDKFGVLNDIFKKDVKQFAYNNTFVVFGLPIMASNYEDLDKKISCLKYDIQEFKHIDYNKRSSLILSVEDYNKKQVIEANPVKERLEKFEKQRQERNNKQSKQLLCKPDIQTDVYHLYDGDTYIGIACVPDYKTSKMLNKLFRIIKENDDLDALELSDDDEEFENEDPAKFVSLDKSYNMVCNFNYKFKKWTPIKIA